MLKIHTIILIINRLITGETCEGRFRIFIKIVFPFCEEKKRKRLDV